MRDVLGPGTVLGYCTNVHAGRTWGEVRANLERVAQSVRDRVCPGEALGVGLWWSREVLGDGYESGEASSYRLLRDLDLLPLTINAFPFTNFHDEIVKHRVYEPDWSDVRRGDYTEGCCVVGALYAERYGAEGLSVSTVPVGWPGRCDVDGSGAMLREKAICMGQLSGVTSVHVTIDLEPEPGCILDTADDVIAFFNEHLPDEVHRRHIGVCHDVCHAAVMFEDQEEVLRRYAEAGIRVNKVQISNCPRVAGRHSSESCATAEGPGSASRASGLEALRAFVEPRYLHQTMVRVDRGGDRSETSPTLEFFEDLPDAFAALDGQGPGSASRATMEAGEWRTHFHVPVYLERIGALETTRDQIMPAILAARKYHDTRFFEVETYAWGVLPDSALEPSWRGRPQEEWLSEGIARELLWVKGEAERLGLSG